MSWAKVVYRLGLVTIIMGGLIGGFLLIWYFFLVRIPLAYVDKGSEMMGSMVDKSTDVISHFVEAANSGTITHEFREVASSVRGTNYLQIATLSSDESFNRKQVSDWYLFQSEVEIEVRIPVEYTYYLDLKEEWTFKWDSDSNELLVHAPQIRFNRPAIDTSKMKVYEINKSLLQDENKLKDEIIQDISNICSIRAQDKTDLIRELARYETERYIRSWLMSTIIQDSSFTPNLEIVFADERIHEPTEPEQVEDTDAPIDLGENL